MLQGILLGLTLSFMVGPLFFSTVQAGLERGFKSGLAFAAGIWLSDLGYVWLIQRSVTALETLSQHAEFKFWAGLGSGLLLIGFGIGGLLIQKTKKFETQTLVSTNNLFLYGVRGFVINTLNPFTVFFWLGIAGAVAAMPVWDRLYFFGGMFGVLITADTAKVWGAEKLQQWLTPPVIRWTQYGIGALLIVFGAVMIVRTVG